MSKLSDELVLCTSTYNDTADFLSFATSLKNECELDLNQFRSRSYKMMFYELYLNNNGNLISIPVETDNLLNGVEKESESLMKRFFMIDNLSKIGASDGYYEQVEPVNIRYAKTVKFKVKIQDEYRKSRIYMPVLKITYAESEDASAKVTFKSMYYMDFKNVKNGINALFWVMFALSLVVVVFRMIVWARLNPSKHNEGIYCCYTSVTLLFMAFKYFGLFMFVFTSGVSAYWYIFFKLQYRPYVLFPDEDEKSTEKYETQFYIVWGLGMCSFCVYMFYRLFQQTNYDVFFIDWEHEKDVLVNNMKEDKTTEKYKGAWRSLHVANMFNQLQQQRTISIPLCFCIFFMLWYYDKTRWNEYAMTVPNFRPVSTCNEHFLLRHCIITFVLFVSGLTQYALVRLVQLWLPLKKTEFLDLCSVSNISVFLLDSSSHGYYIHGQSPLGKADTNFDELVRFLEEEGKGKIRGRGITDDDGDELQSYEMFISFFMRNIYDALFQSKTQGVIQEGVDREKQKTQSRMTKVHQHVPLQTSRIEIDLFKTYMNDHLKEKVETAARNAKMLIREKTLCERFFDLPPNINVNTIGDIIFYKDPGKNFDNVLFTGMELEWLIMVIYWFQMWTISLGRYEHSIAIAALLTYVIEKVLFKCRVFFGERNVARKAIIDDRFFS